MVGTISRRRLFGALGLLGGLLVPSDAAVARDEPLMAREVLTAPRTYYVRSDALYDDAPGLIDSPDGACQTWQQAVDYAESIDFNGHAVTIMAGDEGGVVSFDESFSITALTGGGRLDIKGQPTEGDTVLAPSAPATATIEARGCLTPVYVSDITFEGGTCHIMAVYLATVSLLDGVVFGNATNYHMFVHDSLALISDVNANTKITGDAGYHMLISGGMAFVEYGETTLVGTPDFSGGYFGLTNGGRIQAPGMTFVGSATGPRYWVVMNSVLNTFSSGASYLPGNAAGSTGTGGQYI